MAIGAVLDNPLPHLSLFQPTGLDAYATERSEDAFRALVARHINFVYSAAMRQLRNPALAQEATQSAFIALAEKAAT